MSLNSEPGAAVQGTADAVLGNPESPEHCIGQGIS